MKKPFLTIAAAAITVGLLASCTAPDGDPTPTATPPASGQATVSPTPQATDAAATPAPTSAAPTTILIGAEAVDIVAADGSSLLSVQYSGDGDAAVRDITTVLGEPVRTERTEKSPHYPAVDATIWDGFTVVVNRYDELEDPPTETNYVTDFYVVADAASTAAGVSIATLDGTQVGDNYADVAAGKSIDEVFDDTTFGQDSVTIDLPESFPGIVPENDVPMSWGVVGVTEPESTTIDRIFAPQYLRSLA